MVRLFAFITLFNVFTFPLITQTNLNRQTGLILKNASNLEWKLWGYRLEEWRNNFDFNKASGTKASQPGIPTSVPGSVQKSLLDTKIIQDWNYGLNSDNCEWIENRSWIFTTDLPNDWIIKGKQTKVIFKGLDDNGTVLLNGKEVGTFNNAFIHYVFDLSPFLKESDNKLAIVFNAPPRHLGQVAWTSKIKDWKPRFYYGWDWMPRIVQIGIWDDVLIQIQDHDQALIEELKIISQSDPQKDLGILKLELEANRNALKGSLQIQLKDGSGKYIINEFVKANQFLQEKIWKNLKIKKWWPNGHGAQNLYQLKCVLLNEKGLEVQTIEKTIGFKNVEWLPASGAPIEADPWICVINNKPIFLQGINWTPIRPNFADLKESDYRILLKKYKDLGINMIRIWGGGFPEKDWLYDLCDEYGFLIQQDFPLSSSGLDNYPPETLKEIQVISDISRSYVRRLRHHVSIMMWCGGNELYELGDQAAITNKHLMIKRMEDIVKAEDPNIRFVPGSPSGANIWGDRNNFGKGINWDTHGPWTLPFSPTDSTMNAVLEYWKLDDALMHSEVGVPGTMSVEMINKYRGDFSALPANQQNPIWNRFNWWIEWDEFLKENKDKRTLEEYVKWSQKRQTDGLVIALKTCKDKFPQTGGFIIWMGHDSYPCFVNTSIIDFDGNLKPAALELSKIWKDNKSISVSSLISK